MEHCEEKSERAKLVDKLGHFYHSEHVAKCQPWIREIPFQDWLNRQLSMKGYTIHD